MSFKSWMKMRKACYGFCTKCPQRKEYIKDINGKSMTFITCGLDGLTTIDIPKGIRK